MCLKQYKHRGKNILNDYLYNRSSLVGLILLMDSRHPLKSFDKVMLEWSISQHLPVHYSAYQSR